MLKNASSSGGGIQWPQHGGFPAGTAWPGRLRPEREYNSGTGFPSGEDMKRQFALVCLALLCSACLRATTTITVRQDGSGIIDQEVGANPQAMAMLKGFAGAATADQQKAG